MTDKDKEFEEWWDRYLQNHPTRDNTSVWRALLEIPCREDVRIGCDAHAERVKPLIEAARRAKKADFVRMRVLPPVSTREFTESMEDFGRALNDLYSALDAPTDREGESEPR